MSALTNTQGNQQRGATPAGESSKDTTSEESDTDTTEPEAMNPIPAVLGFQGAGKTVQRGVGHQVLLTCKVEEETYGYKVEERSERNNKLDELDYIDLSQLPSLPSTPLAQQEDNFSISHIGTLAKRPRSPTTNLHEGNDKRFKIEDRSSSDVSALNTCDVPDSSRVSAVPLICFYYYHKGYCNPKRGRKCNYLHDTSTSQQTVSLPYGIDNHSPACALPLCPVRLRGMPESPTVFTQPAIESEPATLRGSAFLDSPDPSLDYKMMVVRGRPLQETLDQSLPLAGPARQLYGEQEHSTEDSQAQKATEAKKDIASVNDVSLHEQRTNKGGKNKRKKRGAKKSTREKKRLQMEKQETIQRELKGNSDALVKQQPLPLFASEQTPESAISLPTSTLAEEQKANYGATGQKWLPAVDHWRAKYALDKVLPASLPKSVHLPNTLQAVSLSQKKPNLPVTSEIKQMSALGVPEKTVASEGAHRRPQEDHHDAGVDAVEYRLPEGGQRLDCKTSLVRRFFDEFE